MIMASTQPNDSLVALILGIEIPVMLLMVTVVGLRFYARSVVKNTLGSDDWVMGIATV